MTPTQFEHLKLIDAHLERLLAIAEKRTAGKWAMNQLTQMFFDGKSWSPPMAIQRHYVEGEQTFAEPFRGWCSYADAAFIASCAGNAEAGWKTLRDEVRGLLEDYDALPGKRWPYGEKRVASILAAFPLELIQKP